MVPHMGDEQKLIALSKQGRQQLEALWAEQRAAEAQRSGAKGWVEKDGA
jgi:glutathione-regulated potassium-efflux system ancillary protein KefC